MTAMPVIPTRQARQDVEDELIHYLVDEGSEQAALGFIAEIEHAYAHLARHPGTGSPRYAYELDVPGLRTLPLDRYPHLIFYIERKEYVEVWRVLNGKCDIPTWLLSDDSASMP
jgi:toxin ParE1/3/4